MAIVHYSGDMQESYDKLGKCYLEHSDTCTSQLITTQMMDAETSKDIKHLLN